MSNDYAGSFNGWEFGTGARPGTSVRALAGWSSRKPTAVVTEASVGGGHVGRVVDGPKQVRLGFNLHSNSPAELAALRDEIDYRFDVGSQVLPLTIDGRIMFVTPLDIEHARDPSWPGPEKTAPCDITFQAGDPGLYSPETDLSFGGDGAVSSVVLDFENLGRRTTRSWRAWRLRITAHGTVRDPYVKLAATGQIVTWVGLTMASGQVLTVGDFRKTQVGSRRVDGFRRSAANSNFPDWPVLQPGENEIEVGCRAGTISGNLFARSTY